MRPEDKELAQLLNEKFIPVRLVNMKGVDLNYFQFDYDLTFAVLMMNANGYVYSRFGTMDHTQTTHRMSIAGLKSAMKAVRSFHSFRQDERPPDKSTITLMDNPAFAQSRQASEACYHCHFVGAFRFKDRRAAGWFKKEMVYQYPLPENIGITLDMNRNNVVNSVIPDSPAEKAGVKPGDSLINVLAPTHTDLYYVMRQTFTAADIQFALNEVPDPGKVTLWMKRGSERVDVVVDLPRGWRMSDVSWRSSQATFPPTVGI